MKKAFWIISMVFVAMAIAGTVFALTGWLPALILGGLTGTVSTDVVESGPFTSLEQAMLPHTGGNATRLFGTYNTVATLAGSLGALLALIGSSPRWLLVYPLAAAAGLLLAARLTPAVERGEELAAEPLPPLHRSRGIVMRLSALFALDSFGGGFVPQTFIAYLFTRKYDASPHTLAVVFFAIGFETTAPSTALTLKRAKAEGLRNFSCVCNHVTIVPPLRALLEAPDLRLDGFIGPGHVATVVGGGVVQGSMGFDVTHARARRTSEGIQRAHLVEDVGEQVSGGDVDAAAPEAGQVVVADLGADRDAPRGGARAHALHRRRIAGMEAAGHVCACHHLEQPVVVTEAPRAEPLSEVGIQVYRHARDAIGFRRELDTPRSP